MFEIFDKIVDLLFMGSVVWFMFSVDHRLDKLEAKKD